MSVSNVKRILFPGFLLNIDNCKVYLFSISKVSPLPETSEFIVSQVVECDGKRSKQFLIFANSQEDYIRKLKKEIALFKAIIYGGSYDIYRSG
jgi:hypothetical protein